jgi:hypothetical protein
VYPDGMIEEMFSGYTRLLEALAADPRIRGEIDFDKLIDAQPQKYSNAADIPGRMAHGEH